MGINIRFTEADWARIARDWNAWWAGELERPLVVWEVTDPVPGADRSQLTKYGLDTPVDQLLDNWQRILEATHWLGDAYPKWGVDFGAGLLAAWLGAGVTWGAETTWLWPLKGVSRLADLHPTLAADNPWWQHILACTRRAVERWGNQVLVAVTDIGGNLDVLASLRGSEKLLLDLVDAPDEVERLAAEITAIWLRAYDQLYALTSAPGRGNTCWAPCWSPGKGYMLQSDFAYMISPRMFKRFVLPDLAACCQHLDYAFYHLDGKGEIPHLDHLLGLERLRGIQWITGDGALPPEAWLPLLQRIRAGGKLCQVFVTMQGALTIQAALGGRGFLFSITEQPASLADAQAFLHKLHAA